MADIGALIERLVASGADPVVAACVVAEAFVCGKDAAPFRDDERSKAAVRQQRFRDRHKALRNVTSVTDVTHNEPSRTVTNHNETVTSLRADETRISYLPSKDVNLSEKKEVSKKDSVTRKRNAPLRDDWTPSVRSFEVAEQFGQNVQIVEGIFRDYLKSSGKLYADYDAAFHNFIRNQKTFNRGGANGVRQPENRGSIVNAADRAIANLEREIAADNETREGIVLSLPSQRL